jgi:hypothetical protein
MNYLRSLERWDRGFESHSRHGCLCARLFCACVALCAGGGLATGWFPVQGVLPPVYRLRNWRSGQGPTNGCRPIIITIMIIKQKKLRGLSPQANYTDRATAACRRSYCQLLRLEGVAWSAQRIPTAVFSVILDRSRYCFFRVAPQLYSRGWVDPIPDPLLIRKSRSAGNRTRELWICSQELWRLDHRGGQ